MTMTAVKANDAAQAAAKTSDAGTEDVERAKRSQVKATAQKPAPVEGAADGATSGDQKPPTTGADSDAPDKPKAPTYRVAPRKAITSRRGVLGPGEEVSERDFDGGQETLDVLVGRGLVIRS